VTKRFRPEYFPKNGVFFLEASAGTGKTYALERTVSQLIGRYENPLRIEDILVVTFTNRAAKELKERIRIHLTNLSKVGKEEERDRYRRAISSFDRAAIYTIHSFCQMVLASWPFETSSPFRQELLIGKEIEELETRAWITGLQKEDSNWDLIRAAYHKSAEIEKLISDLVDGIVSDSIPDWALVKPDREELSNFVDFFKSAEAPGSVLGKAADELFGGDWSIEEISAVLKKGGKNKRAKSIEKIRNHMKLCKGVRNLFSLSKLVFGESHFRDLLAVALSSKSTSTNSKPGSSLANALLTFFEQMKPYVERPFEDYKLPNSLVERYMQFAFFDFAMDEIRKRVECTKLSTGQWGYADLIHRVVESVLMPNSPLLPILRSRFSAALIDEFQDTDPRQWKLFKRIFGEDSGHILGLIGDPKQSIYGFRGTGLQAYLEARKVAPRSRIFRLGTNYRSKENLVRAINKFFAPLFESTEFGFNSVESGYQGKRVLEWPEAKAAINLLGVKSRRDSALLIANHIRRLLDVETGGFWRRADGSRERVLASDIAVLVRKKSEEEEIFLRLKELGIQTQKLRSTSVFTQKIVRLLDGMLDAFDSPRDASRWRSLLLGGFFSLPPVYLDSFEREGRLDEFVEKGDECRTLFNSGHATKAIEDFLRFSTILGDWICVAGDEKLGAYLAKPWTERILAEPDGERIWQDWRHICELIQRRQSDGMRDISLIREWIGETSTLSYLEENAVRLESDKPAVWVLTMHKAKGLEFPLVFIHAGYNTKKSQQIWKEYRFVERGKLTIDRLKSRSNRMRHTLFEWEENKRLWYVAFTRAVEKLWSPLVLEGALTEGESLLIQALGEEYDSSKIPPHQIIAGKDVEAFRKSLNEHLTLLCKEYPELFSFSIDEPLELSPLESVVTPEPVGLSRPATFFGDRDLVQSSFTSLIGSLTPKGENFEVAVDNVPLGSYAGKRFGDLIHKLFELCDFEKAREFEEDEWCENEGVEAFFRNTALNFYDLNWYMEWGLSLKKMVWRSLRAKIPDLGCLCDVGVRKAEVEFFMAIRNGSRLHGFLTGRIDLLICVYGRWWLVDWKTNLPSAKNWEGVYDYKTMRLIMDEHCYHFQYELYLLALCGSISSGLGRAVDWNEEIGGAVYVFARGTEEGNSGGIYFAKPSRERMLTLALAMGAGNLLK